MKTAQTSNRSAREGKKLRRKARNPRGPRPRRLWLEPLEDRRLLATFTESGSTLDLVLEQGEHSSRSPGGCDMAACCSSRSTSMENWPRCPNG